MWPFRRNRPAPVRYDTQQVYLMHCAATGLYKIGISQHPTKRKRQVELNSGHLVTIIQTWLAEDARAIEAALHKNFAEKRQEGEWFALTPEDVFAMEAVLGGAQE